MTLEGRALKVTVFFGESDRWRHQPLHTALVELLRREGCAGATVLRGVEGFGQASRIHSAHILRLSEDLPMVLVFVDRAERVETLLPVIEGMLDGGLMTVEELHVRHYASGRAGGASA
ncbi:MAG: DUF190 domain-containing protein [bacterium]|nr:DUF190 domain-containing protein [bacterium]